MPDKQLEPHIAVILGGKGDLMGRKLLPSIYHLSKQDYFTDNTIVLGVARDRTWNDAKFRSWSKDELSASGYSGNDARQWCDNQLYYHPAGEGELKDYQSLAERVNSLEKERGLPGNRVFYLAIPPGAYPSTITALGEAGVHHGKGWTRIVIEKPFGRDLQSARALNQLIHKYFDESQIYRIDHYLGKETVQNLMAFRFGNAIFESLWNRDRIQNVQIIVAEELGVEHRAGYYERAGALRDMVQNHLTQLLTITAMEVPAAFEADAIRHEKIKVLRSIAPIQMENLVFGQYGPGTIDGKDVPGYRQEPGIAADSQTETFVSMRLEIDNWRWQGVPFILRTGKRLQKRLSQIIVNFRRPPISIFRSSESCQVHPNVLTITVQPDEGFDLSFEVKAPGAPLQLQTQSMRFRYADAFGPLPDAYETLLLDIVRGDQTLFVHAEETEASWQLYSPLLDQPRSVKLYPAGSWGPKEAGQFILNTKNSGHSHGT
jgi:glucose-6-phosphate 1-dehydrogenase